MSDECRCDMYRGDGVKEHYVGCPALDAKHEAAPTVEREQILDCDKQAIAWIDEHIPLQFDAGLVPMGSPVTTELTKLQLAQLLAAFSSSVLQEVRKQVEDEYDPLDETMYGCGHRDGIRDVLALLDKMEGK